MLGRMLGSRALVARLAPRHQATRHKGILSSFKESIDKEMKKNPELQKTLDELREGAAPLTKSAQEAASKLSSAAAQGASQAAERAGKAADAAAKAADAAAKAGEAAKARATEAAAKASQSEIAQKAEQMASQARQAMDDARAKASEAAGGAAGGKEAGAGGEAGSGAGAGAGGEAPPLYVRLMEDVENLFRSAKERLFAGTGVAVGRAPGPDDTESRGVVVKEPSFWEKATNQAGQSAFMRGFAGFAGAAGEGVSGVADRVMGENEQAEAVAMLREQMPHFDQEVFLEHIKTTMAPEVLGAYLKGEVAPVKLHCREQALAQLQALMNERNERNLLMSDVELEAIRIIGGNPTPVVSFETHQLHCIRSRATAAIVEGDEDDIRSVHYLWALQQREDITDQTPERERWQVTELAVRGMMSTY